MKKILFTIFAFAPIFVNAQAYHDSSENWAAISIMLIIAVVIFILCRELICWYYKINKRISNQDEIIKLLKEISDKLDKQ